MQICIRCWGARWVCEAHTDQPWGNDKGCLCGAPGSPCPICNRVAPEGKPAMPDGFKAEAEAEFDPPLDDAAERAEVQEALRRIFETARRKH